MSRGSSVSMVTRFRAGRSGMRVSVGVRSFYIVQNVRPALGPPSLGGYRCFIQGIMQPGRDVDHSPPSSAEFKNEWSCISSSPVCLYGLQWDNFTFFFSCISEYPRFGLRSSPCTLRYLLYYVFFVTLFTTYSAIRSFLRPLLYVFYTNNLSSRMTINFSIMINFVADFLFRTDNFAALIV